MASKPIQGYVFEGLGAMSRPLWTTLGFVFPFWGYLGCICISFWDIFFHFGDIWDAFAYHWLESWNVFWFVTLCVIFPFRNWWLCRHEFVTKLLKKSLVFTMVFVQWVISACDVTCSNICVYWVLLWITIFLQFYFNFTLNLIKNPSKNGWSTRKHGLVTSKRPARLSFERFGPMLRQSCDHFGSFWNDLGSFWTFKNILNTFKTSGIA